jgi:predicted MPP superfamily phosphohydrolase
MSSSRRDFLKNLGLSAAFSISGGFTTMASPDFFDAKNKVKLRFLVASDFHFGQAKTDFMGMTNVFLKQANAIHKIQKFDYCVLNGDLIHDNPEFMPQVKSQFDSLDMPYFVTKGNHDMVDDQTWENIWKMPSNHSFATKKYAIILANTSNEKGEYLSPNIEWVSKKLEEFKNIENVFVFAHIPQFKKQKMA